MERVDRRGAYTISEAAEILQFHPDAIRYWLRVGELVGDRVAERDGWLIRPEALVSFLRQNGETLPSALPGTGSLAAPAESVDQSL